jgi:hypothetical protein
MLVLGGYWKQAKEEGNDILGNKGMHEESDSWKEAQHMRMQGR